MRLVPRPVLPRCAFCHDDIGQAPWLCTVCGALLHLECWTVAESCPSIGCPTRYSTATATLPGPGWTPGVGSSLLAAAALLLACLLSWYRLELRRLYVANHPNAAAILADCRHLMSAADASPRLSSCTPRVPEAYTGSRIALLPRALRDLNPDYVGVSRNRVVVRFGDGDDAWGLSAEPADAWTPQEHHDSRRVVIDGLRLFEAVARR